MARDTLVAWGLIGRYSNRSIEVFPLITYHPVWSYRLDVGGRGEQGCLALPQLPSRIHRHHRSESHG